MNTKPPNERKTSQLLVSVTKSDKQLVDRISEFTGMSKSNLVMFAIKHQFNNRNLEQDRSQRYAISLSKQIEASKERIRMEQEHLEALIKEYEALMAEIESEDEGRNED